jgi:hypothetical protein
LDFVWVDLLTFDIIKETSTIMTEKTLFLMGGERGEGVLKQVLDLLLKRVNQKLNGGVNV